MSPKVRLSGHGTTITPEILRALKLFTGQGVRFSGLTSSGQVQGTCIFCGSKDHLFVNTHDLAWDCKKCHLAGGPFEFMRDMSEYSKKFFTGEVLRRACTSRSLKASTLKKLGMGFNPQGGRNGIYIIPTRKIDDPEKVQNISWWVPGEQVKVCPRGKTGLLGWEHFEKVHKVTRVWIAEGHWDYAAFLEILSHAKGELVVGAPGAGTFQPEWAGLFDGLDVVCAYDNDPAGYDGAVRVYNVLKPVCRSLSFVHWPATKAKGFDVRDLYIESKCDGTVTYSQLRRLSDGNTMPPNSDTATVQIQAPIEEKFIGTGLDYREVYARYRKWLYFPEDCYLLSAVFGSVIANRRDGDPLWLYVVGVPGATKTEVLRSLENAPKIVVTDTITPSGLVSGMNAVGGADPSLLRIMHGKTLVITDYTTILGMKRDDQEEISSIFRKVFDGSFEKRFGNGLHRKYNPCKMAIIAAVTPAIEQQSESNSALGPRFIQFWIRIDKSIKAQRMYAQRAFDNESKEKEMREELSATACEVLSKDYSLDEVTVPPDIAAKLIDLALITSKLRGTVPRDKYSKDITHRGYHELATRISKQNRKFAVGLAQFHGTKEVGELEYTIVKQCAVDSIPSGTRSIMKAAWKQWKDKPFDLREMGRSVGLPAHTTVARIAQDLVSLGALQERSSGIGSLNVKYLMHDDVLEALSTTGAFE